MVVKNARYPESYRNAKPDVVADWRKAHQEWAGSGSDPSDQYVTKVHESGDRIAAAGDALARELETERERQWISVEERLPAEDGYYLFSEKMNSGSRTFCMWVNGGEALTTAPEIVTHWMPLPPAPEGV
jgi:hypothetical protein